jgi:hypothetical protein
MFKVIVSYTICHVLGGRWCFKGESSPHSDDGVTDDKSYDAKGARSTIECPLIPNNKIPKTVGEKRFDLLPHAATEKRQVIRNYGQRETNYDKLAWG